jgi:hypothetical protein
MAFSFTLFLALCCVPRTAYTQPAGTAPAAYEQALAVADIFLWDWLSRDTDDAYLLLSPHAKAEIRDRSWFSLYISGLSNPRHQAFEIWEGKGDDRHYQFNVTVYELATAMNKGDKFTSRVLKNTK